jgi:hypothetical protein
MKIVAFQQKQKKENNLERYFIPFAVLDLKPIAG